LAAILLVEDNDDVREMMSLALQLDGHQVEAVANGRDALAALRAGLRPCLILLDLMMPVMNGWELRAALRSEPACQDIPVVVISAVHPEIAGRLRDTLYVPKPVDIDTLLDMVCTYCRENDARPMGHRGRG
jgi:CheY-like chemotaxis protein